MSWRRFLCRREHISSSSEQKNFFRSESSVIYVTASRVTKLNIYRFSDINSRQQRQQDYDDQKTISLPSLSTRWLAIFYLLPFPPSPPKKVFQVAPNAHKDCCSIWLERKNACFLNGSFPTSFDFHLYCPVKAIFLKNLLMTVTTLEAIDSGKSIFLYTVEKELSSMLIQSSK